MAKLSIVKNNEVVNDAAELLFERGQGDHGTEEEPKTFEDLTAQDKLDLVKVHQKQVIVDLANTGKSQAAQKEARELEEDSKHII
jgi:hypothetical protein